MRKLLLFIFILGMTPLGQARIQIGGKVSNERVPIFDISGVIVEDAFDGFGTMGFPTGAYIILKMTGKLEGNICPHSEYALNTEYVNSPQPSTDLVFDMTIVPTSFHSGTINISEQICTLQSEEEWFAVSMRIDINSWDVNQQKQIWSYTVKDSNKAHGIIEVTFESNKGWSLDFQKL